MFIGVVLSSHDTPEPLASKVTRLARDMRDIGQAGFTLIEAIAALMILGTSVLGAVVLLGTTVSSSAETEGRVTLQLLAQSQIELIQQSPFLADPTGYPTVQQSPDGAAITSLETSPNGVTLTFSDGVILSFSAVDPGTTYTFPEPDGGILTKVIQRISVTTSHDGPSTTFTFYKIDSP